ELLDQQEHQRAKDDDENGELPGDDQGGAEGHGGFETFLHGIAEEGFEAILKPLRLLRQAAGDVAGSFLAEERERHVQRVVVEAIAEVAHGENGGFFGEKFLHETDSVAEDGKKDQERQYDGNGFD